MTGARGAEAMVGLLLKSPEDRTRAPTRACQGERAKSGWSLPLSERIPVEVFTASYSGVVSGRSSDESRAVIRMP